MKTNLKTFPEIKNFKQHSHDCVVWKIAFEKELRGKIETANYNAKTWRENFQRSTTKDKDSWYESAAEEWEIVASELKEILGET